MKKILFLLLSSVVMYGQVPADATPLENVQITNNVISTTAPFVNVQSSTGVVNKINKTDLVDAIIVNTTAELTPAIGNINKLYATRDNNILYRFNGTIYVPLSGIIPHLEANTNDKTVWNNGKGDMPSNTSFGDFAGASNTSGTIWGAFGNSAGFANTTGSAWTAIGSGAGAENITGSTWTAIGRAAGRFASNGTTALSTLNESIFIGANSKGLNSVSNNEIVLGTNATGAGDNSLTLGNLMNKKTVIKGRVSQITTAEASDTNHDGYFSDYTSEFAGYNFHGLRSGNGGGGVFGAAYTGSGNGDGIVGRRRDSGAGNGGTFKREETGTGEAILALNSSSADGRGVFALRQGTGTGEALNVQHNNTSTSAAAFIHRYGASDGDVLFIKKEVSAVGYGINILGGQGVNMTGGLGGCFILNSDNVNKDNVSFIIKNSASKQYAFTAGKQGVTNFGFGFWNRSDNTFPLWITASDNIEVPNKVLIGTTADNGSKLQVAGAATFSSSVSASLLKPTVYTVATLPTPPSTGTGTYATVSDAVAPAYLTPVMGGGTVVTPVFYNGSNWICH